MNINGFLVISFCQILSNVFSLQINADVILWYSSENKITIAYIYEQFIFALVMLINLMWSYFNFQTHLCLTVNYKYNKHTPDVLYLASELALYWQGLSVCTLVSYDWYSTLPAQLFHFAKHSIELKKNTYII